MFFGTKRRKSPRKQNELHSCSAAISSLTMGGASFKITIRRLPKFSIIINARFQISIDEIDFTAPEISVQIFALQYQIQTRIHLISEAKNHITAWDESDSS